MSFPSGIDWNRTVKFLRCSVLFAQMTLLSLIFKIYPPQSFAPRVFITSERSEILRWVRTALFLITIASLLVTIYRWPPPPTPLKSGRKIVNAGIWTVHFGVDNAGRDSQRRMMDLIR